MTADLAQRLRDWAGAVAHRDLEAGLREAADAIDAEIRLSGSRLRHLNEAEARLAAAELVVEAARTWAKEMEAYAVGAETHFPAVEDELHAALAGYEKAYSGLSRKEAEKHDKATHPNSSGTSRSHVVPAEADEGPDDLDLYIERRKAAAYSEKDDGWSKIEGVRWRNPDLNVANAVTPMAVDDIPATRSADLNSGDARE